MDNRTISDSSFAALKNADVEEAGLVLLTKLSAGTLSRNDRLPRGRAKRTIHPSALSYEWSDSVRKNILNRKCFLNFKSVCFNILN